MKFEIKGCKDEKKVRFELQESGGTVYLKAFYEYGGEETFDYVCSFDQDNGKLERHYMSSFSPMTRDSKTGYVALEN